MQRSRLRKLRSAWRSRATSRRSRSTVLCTAPMRRHGRRAQAARSRCPADAQRRRRCDEVIVTAQKRTENLQNVPISIQALGTEKLEELQRHELRRLREVPAERRRTRPVGPGFAQVYMRGVASGGDGNHSGSLPSVGIYLDEQPVTTIEGALDIHIYDIARVEALAGPQGTLYGASSEAGTIRIITNKPDPSRLQGRLRPRRQRRRTVSGGYIAEGFVKSRLSANAAMRLVGWAEHDAGYIDNVKGTAVFPSDGCMSNFSPPDTGCESSPTHAKQRFNPVETYGGRAALKVNLGDNWTISPTFMGQSTRAEGTSFVDPSIPGGLSVQRYYPDGISRSVVAGGPDGRRTYQ